MRRYSPATLAFALPVTLAAQMAAADLTPAEVWGDWRQYMEGMGYTVTAEETTDGGVLTVSGISFGMQFPDNQGEMAMDVGTIRFEDQGNGTVAIVLPDTMPITMDVAPPAGEGEPGKMQMDLTQTGHKMIASGTPDQITTTYTAQSMGINMNQFEVDGTTLGDDVMRMNFAINGVTNTTTMTDKGDLRGYDQQGTMDAITFDFFVEPPDEPAKVGAQGGVQSVAYTGTGTIPGGQVEAADMSRMIAAGFDVTGTFTYGNGQTDVNVNDPQGGSVAATTSSDGGTLKFQMGAGGLGYDVEQTNTKLSATLSELPFPIDMSMARSAFNVVMPVGKSDDPQDFAFGMALQDFVMSDMIWGIFDPTSQLPRDPATIALDLTGQAKMFVDFFSPDSAEMLATQTPGELQSLKMNNLTVDVAGARLDGTGDFAFDNTDMTTFPGMPKPVGEVNLNLVGGNGLLDKLVAMGLLPQDQAMGARMMMGLFAVPGDAPDTLSSKIEFNEEGQVLANGQRIQ
ncbi:DUF2125 domain-containing protein [Sulfitobacter sp. JB4-11]|uniref:DUF2125 domain-containing protein n=1 Tax=Sulfitobacter rhodophyticola TaxID=3238304 RepID=UPI003D812D29